MTGLTQSYVHGARATPLLGRTIGAVFDDAVARWPNNEALAGRIGDMLIRGGENIYPREIEAFLYGHSKVDAVEVFGVPDPRYGEEVCAWIKLREGETATAEEMRGFCRDRIAHFKIPRYIKFVEAYPMTVTGKVQKFVMRARMIGELGLDQRKSA